MNAFCAWLHDEGHAAGRVKLSKLRVERRVLQLLDETQMRVLIGYKSSSFGQRRVHLAALLILDSGLRIAEALNLRDCAPQKVERYAIPPRIYYRSLSGRLNGSSTLRLRLLEARNRVRS